MKNVLIAVMYISILLISTNQLCAELLISDLNTLTLDFNDFEGQGFAPGRSRGALDSTTWITFGLSDSTTMNFGDTQINGDFACGTHTGGTSKGGFYAWKNGNDTAAGWQATTSDATPGSLVLRLKNNTGDTIEGFTVSFDRWMNNDQERSSSLDFGFSFAMPQSAGDTGTLADAYTSPVESDDLGFQSVYSGPITIAQSLSEDDEFYLIWSTDDYQGSGSRDEIGISNISITPIATPLPSTLVLFAAPCLMGILMRRKK